MIIGVATNRASPGVRTEVEGEKTMSVVGKELGSYRIIKQLGRGGMADVYKAYQPRLDRYVAIKILPAVLARDETFLARFEREAKAVAGLYHRNILTVYDYGEEEGQTYLVMAYVEGGTLKARMGQFWGLNKTADIISQVGDALAYAHRRGVIHRDVKPANILMMEEDWPLLSDFGLAKMVEPSVQLTKTGMTVGTPEYMSPEQAAGVAADERSDIYSLGVVLYEMVTGRPPFQADTPLAVILKHVNDPLPLPRKFRPDLPRAVERVILKALAKNPDDRYQKVEDMVAALKAAVAGELPPAVEERPPQVSAAPAVRAEAPTPPPAAPVERVVVSRKGRPAWKLGVVVGIVLLVVIGGIYLRSRRAQLLATLPVAVSPIALATTLTPAPTTAIAILRPTNTPPVAKTLTDVSKPTDTPQVEATMTAEAPTETLTDTPAPKLTPTDTPMSTPALMATQEAAIAATLAVEAAIQTAVAATQTSVAATLTAQSPTDTPTATNTPTPTNTPTETPTTTPVSAPQLPTLRPTAEITPTLTITLSTLSSPVPILLEPEEDFRTSGDSITLKWIWGSGLEEGWYFDIQIRPKGEGDSVFVDWAREPVYELRKWAGWRAGEYTWTIAVIRGHYEGDQKVFEEDLNLAGEARLFRWDEVGGGGGSGKDEWSGY